jgi:hypothetical protein
MIVLPVALAVPFDWRALVSATLGGIMTLLTNPRLVPGVRVAMPDAGSSTFVPPNLSDNRDRTRGHATPTILLLLAFAILAIGTVFLIALPADAAELAQPLPGNGVVLSIPVPPNTGTAAPIDTGCEWQRVSPLVYRCGKLTLQPAFAAAAGQLNLRKAIDDGFDSAYQRVSFLAGYGFTYHGDSVTMGASVYGGAGVASNQPNAPQANALLTFWDILAVGPGVTTFKEPSGKRVYQMLLSLAVNYSAGGTTAKILPMLDKIVEWCADGAVCAVP